MAGGAVMSFRMGSQNHVLLNELRNRPLTNFEIIRIVGCLKYTSRISDLRAAGYEVIAKNEGGGTWTYYLREKINLKFFERGNA